MSKGTVNKVILIGNLGKDPELRYTPSGKANLAISLATTETVKGEDRTEWHRVILWEKQAEYIGKYAVKGSKIYIEGAIKTRSYEQGGVMKYTTEIIGRHVDIVGSKQSKEQEFEPAGPDIGDEDLPF